MAPRRPPVKPLTGLRIIAALLVVAYHSVALHPHGSGLGAALVLLASRVVSCGFVGVPLFFILSGFILTYNYSDDEAGGMRVTPRAFWLARFARIYPAYIVGFLLATGPYLWSHHATLAVRAVTVGLALSLMQSW